MAWVAFILLPLGFVANVCLIYHFLVYDFKWKNMHILTFNLATSDLLQIIATAIAIAMRKILKNDIEFIMEVSTQWFISVSIFHIFLLAAERLLSIKAPFWAQTNLSKHRTTIASALVWVGQAFIHSAGILVLIYCTHEKKWEERIYDSMYVFSWNSLIMSGGILLLHSYVTFILINQSRHQKRRLKKELSTFIYCTAIALAFVTTHCPFNVSMVRDGYGREKMPKTGNILILINNILNPLLYLAKELVDRKQKQPRAALIEEDSDGTYHCGINLPGITNRRGRRERLISQSH